MSSYEKFHSVLYSLSSADCLDVIHNIASIRLHTPTYGYDRGLLPLSDYEPSIGII